MSELDDMLELRFDGVRELLVFDLDTDEWDDQFPPSLIVHWKGATWLVLVHAETGVLQLETIAFSHGHQIGDSQLLSIQPLPSPD